MLFASALRTAMGHKRGRVAHAMGIASGTIPFVFAVIRAVTTGSDTRYLWVALAATAGAALVVVQPVANATASLVVRSLLSFVLATAAAVLAARALGTAVGPGLFVVACAFAFCSAAGVMLCSWRGGRIA